MQALSQLSYTPVGFIEAHEYNGASAAFRSVSTKACSVRSSMVVPSLVR